VIEIDGSSTVYPITEAVAEEYQAAGGARVTVGISGTGGGFKRFCRGETDISDASRPILKEEMVLCAQAGIKYFELPVAYDAITVVVSKDNDFVDHLTVEELKKMWEPAAAGKITSWKQVRDSFPDVPLKLAGAGADSGTFDYFTEAVVGVAKSSRGDYRPARTTTSPCSSSRATRARSAISAWRTTRRTRTRCARCRSWRPAVRRVCCPRSRR